MAKILGFILAASVIIAGAGLWYWKTHKKKIIRNELEKAIREKSQGLYKINYAGLELDEVTGFLSVSSFTLKYDSIKYIQLESQQKQPYLPFPISIPQIEVTGVQTDRALLEKEIRGRHLVIQNPVVEIIYTNAGKDSSRTIPDKQVYQQILGNLNLIRLDTVVISGAEVITKSMKTGKTYVHFFNTAVTMFDVAVDSTADADTTRLLFAKEVNVDCEKFTWQSKNKLYNYQADSIAFRSAQSHIRVKSLSVRPQLKEDEFVRSFPVQTDRFDFAIRNIQLKNADFYSLADESIIADTLQVGSASFKIYRDRNQPAVTASAVGNYPHQVIRQIPFKLDIKKGIVGNIFIEYKEKSSITHQTGKVQLWNTSAYITNITNRKESIARNNLMVFDMRSRLLNKIPIAVRWTFYLGDPNGKFAIRGKGGQGEAIDLNPLTIPMGPVELTSGHINGFEFDMTGSDYTMNGKVKLLYNDLHIALLKKDDDSIHFKKKKVTSLFANMKIKNANPEKDKEPRIASINYQRNIHASIFNLAWKSFFTGVQEITGAK